MYNENQCTKVPQFQMNLAGDNEIIIAAALLRIFLDQSRESSTLELIKR